MHLRTLSATLFLIIAATYLVDSVESKSVWETIQGWFGYGKEEPTTPKPEPATPKPEPPKPEPKPEKPDPEKEYQIKGKNIQQINMDADGIKVKAMDIKQQLPKIEEPMKM